MVNTGSEGAPGEHRYLSRGRHTDIS